MDYESIPSILYVVAGIKSEESPELQSLERKYPFKEVNTTGLVRAVTQSSLFRTSYENSLITFLVSRGEDVNVCDKSGRTPLYVACAHDVWNTLFLLQNKADVNAYDFYGYTPIHNTLHNERPGTSATLASLLSYGADVRATNNDGWTALHMAFNYRRRTSAPLLVLPNAGAMVNAPESRGRTPLMVACANGWEVGDDLMRLLLKHGADVHARDNMQRTVLHIACEHQDEECVRLLLDAGADIEACSKSGQTPLHVACEQWNSDVVRLLLHNKARTDARNLDGATPLRIAVKKGFSDIEAILLQHMDLSVGSGRV